MVKGYRTKSAKGRRCVWGRAEESALQGSRLGGAYFLPE